MEVVFWKSTTDQSWSCSIGYIDVKMVDGTLCQMKWGPDPEQQIVFEIADISASDFGHYLHLWHDVELVAANTGGESGQI